MMMSPFTLLQQRYIPEINATVKHYVHDKTGARLLSVLNDDENKVFGVSFRTPPRTSNGIAHIMEHAVLCGSRKYRVKEPFIELSKGSLNTFLNAMTFPDKTCYPLASQNLQDLYNLADVYLDAVFYPLISEYTLMQEGWHYELEAPDAPLAFKGVVFNEMKGNYSSPDSLLYEYSQRSLFPDSPYGLDAGGDPAVIPDLAYAEFKAFHESYYHPSNAYIWFYGDDPEERRLAFLEGWLEGFERREPHSDLVLQPRFDAPRRLVQVYDAAGIEDPKAYVTLNWLMPEAGHPDTLGLSVLAHVLTATPASPLRKALIDSGLGEDMAGAGFEESLKQMYYATGMKGVAPENLEKVERLILDTLRRLAADGLDSDTVAASINTIEFRLREQNTGRYPRGLFMMLTALSAWLYDGDPFEALAFEAPLDTIKQKITLGVPYFENLIQTHLLDNPHRTAVHLLPDPEEGRRREAAEQARLAAAKAAMSAGDLAALAAAAAELKRRQDAPDAPEALASIPSLALDDIEKQVKTIPLALQKSGKTPVLYHDLFTNGIAYLDLGFDMHYLPVDLLPFMGLFGRALLEMGTQTQDFVRLIQRIGQQTGGIRSGVLTSTIRESSDSALWFFLRGKAVASRTTDLLDILRDVLLTANFDNLQRFQQIVLEEKARAEAGLVPGGHIAVNQRLRARFSEAGWVAEQIGGVDYLFFLRRLVQDIENDWPGVLARLEAVRQALVHRRAVLVNITLDEANWQTCRPQVDAFLDALPDRPMLATAFQRPGTSAAKSADEGLTIPAQVNYVGKGGNLYALGYEPHGSVHVINNYLNSTFLWEKVRVQGGAYGGFSVFDQASGVFTFLSYRDPNLLGTLDTYDQVPRFLRQLDLSPAELTKTIIGVIGELDAYMLPDAKGYTAMVRYLTHYTDEERQKIRDEVLSAGVRDFKQFAEVLAMLAENGETVVLGSADAIEKANQERKGMFEVKKVL
ncbi:MAG: insulinase family protein [Chloroflexota bacterium]